MSAKIFENYHRDFQLKHIVLSDIWFYDPENKCSNCFIGGSDSLIEGKKQLFAVRVEELQTFKIPIQVVKTIYYPNGEKAFYIIRSSF